MNKEIRKVFYVDIPDTEITDIEHLKRAISKRFEEISKHDQSSLLAMIDDDGGDAEDDDDTTKSPWYSTGSSAKNTGTSSNTGIGTIGQTIAQQINKGSAVTNLPAGSWPFNTSGHQLLTGSQSKKPIKTSMRFIICKKDGTTLELKEQSQITPQEMIGISKFMALVSTVLSTTSTSYNINIQWSDVITSLGITNHFVAGKTVNQYLAIETDILDIMLHDSR